jgi:hypothetical protein
MKKFIIKGFVFLIPFILLFGFSLFFYSTDKGDLIRVGYIMDWHNYTPGKIFNEAYNQPIHFTKISEINLKTKHHYKVLTIGDSFSEQDSYGYKNYLSKNDSISLLYYDRFLHENPIETLFGVVNGNLLDSIQIDYIILQSIERILVKRAIQTDTSKVILIDSLNKFFTIEKLKSKKLIHADKLFSNVMLKFALNNAAYLINDHAYKSETYKVKTTKQLFSVNKNELLFYFEDLQYVGNNANDKSLNILNNELNILSEKLKKRGIKLIFLPSPDKFDIYYPYIENKEKYPAPVFFENFNKLKKDYLYVDTKRILSEAIKVQKDIYYYDDTHWTPYASILLANELGNIIKRN